MLGPCVCVCVCVCVSVMSDSLLSHELYPTRPLCPWYCPGKSTGVCYHSLLQGIFLTQGSNLGLLLCRQILYYLSHQGSLVKSVNQGKLDVVNQEMVRLNVDILRISELKWKGMDEFNSDDHCIYYCGQKSLRRNGVALIVNRRV